MIDVFEFISLCLDFWTRQCIFLGSFKTWRTPLVYLLVYPYIVVFGQVSETF